MTLDNARKGLDELETFTHNFLLLNPFLQIEEDDPTMALTDETTQNSLRLMNEIRSTSLWTLNEVKGTRLFTLPTPYDDKTVQTCLALMDGVKSPNLNTILSSDDENPNSYLIQAFNNLCVTITAMRLLSYGLLDFLRDNCSQIVLKDLKTLILKNQKNLINICCGVISPRPLNGLNQCKLDDDFQIAAQVQNMRELKYEKGLSL